MESHQDHHTQPEAFAFIEETLRFFALRLGDVKLIKSTPQQIINLGSDVAYVRQLRTQLKA